MANVDLFWDIYDNFFLSPQQRKIIQYSVYNPETHELVPRKDYQRKLVEAKESKMKELQTEIDKLRTETEELKQKL